MCNKILSTKASLNLHIKVGTCLKKRDTKKFTCEYCEKALSSKQMLQYHIESCNKKITIQYENDIEKIKLKYEEKIKKLECDIEDLMKYKNTSLEELCRKCIYLSKCNKNSTSVCSKDSQII
jgi:hypothetical protein